MQGVANCDKFCARVGKVGICSAPDPVSVVSRRGYFAGAPGVAAAGDCGWLSMYMARGVSFLAGFGFAVAAPLNS